MKKSRAFERRVWIGKLTGRGRHEMNGESGKMFFRKRKRKSALSLAANYISSESSSSSSSSSSSRSSDNKSQLATTNICLTSTIIIIVIASIMSTQVSAKVSRNSPTEAVAEAAEVNEASISRSRSSNMNSSIKNRGSSVVTSSSSSISSGNDDQQNGGNEEIVLSANQTTILSKPSQIWLSYQTQQPLVANNMSRRAASIAATTLLVTARPLGRFRRSIQKGDSTRIVAISGQWIELQCPLASELLAVANSGAPDSRPDHNILWRKNGVKLNQLNPRQKVNALNGSLVIVSAQPKLDEAAYECALVQTTKEDEPLKLHRFDLKLIVPPRLSPFEFPADAQVGMKVVLTCSVLEGQQPISFVWLKDNQIISGNDQQHSSHASTQALAHQANSLNQLHQQQLADKFALSAQVSFSSHLPANNQKSEYVILGDSASFSPSSSSSTSSPKSETTKGDQQVSDNSQQLLPLLSDSNIRIRQSDDYSILSIDKLELKHSGRYTCSVQNEAARTSHSSQLAINAPPTLAIEPKDGDLVSGQSTVIDCAASGQPRPTISWLRAREQASSKQWDYLPVYDNLRYTTLPNGSLAIANVTQREQGYYLCSAKNGFGPEVTKLIKITVHEPAKFSSKYKTVEVRIEERANMVCVASGELPIGIEWLDKEGNTIQKSDKKFIIDNDPYDIGTGSETNVNTTISRLILARSGRSDSGHYTCQATNKYGSDKMVTSLLVQDVPDKVTDLKVTNATSSTISIRWQLAFSGNSPITSYLVQYQSDDPLDDLLMSSNVGGNAISRPQTTAGGQSATANPTDDLLLAAAGSTQPQPSSTSSLRAALDALNVASSLENADEAIDRTLVELTVEQSSTHLVVKDLSPYCVYRLRLAGINKIGLGEFSEWIRAKTEEAPPSGNALKIMASATGPNSIKITWSPPDRRSWNGQLIGFNIGYRPIDSSFELNKTVEWTPPTLQSIMLDVDKQRQSKKQQSIHSQVHQTISNALTSASQQSTNINNQQKNASKAKQLQLIGDNSSQVITNNSSQIGGDNPSLSSTAAPSAAISNSQYILRQHLRQLLALQQQELVAHLTNLQRSTTYLVWIQAVNNRGFGPQSHAISVKTLDDVPPSAPAIKIQSTTPNSITIAWSMLSNFVSSANQYSLFYRRVPQLTANNRPNSSLLIDQISSSSSISAHDGPQLSQLFEPGPFIERTVNSQQLMMSGNVYLGNTDQEPQLIEVKPSFMHQQSQHYQQFVYTLDQLECGSVYELYMTTRNSVGKSEPSAVVTTRTLGEPPLAPINKNSLFTKIGINEVSLNLAAWSTGGCPLTHVTVRYKQAPIPLPNASAASSPAPQTSNNSSQSSAVTVSWPITTSVPPSLLATVNNQLLQQTSRQQSIYSTNSNNGPQMTHKTLADNDMLPNMQPIFMIKNLMPSSCYDLEIIAYNAAGHTMAQYEFVTSNINGSRSGYSRKEGIFRIDQRVGSMINDQPLDSSRIIEQQASFANQSGAGWQLIPLILMMLCFVCLIISSTFCYYRLTDTWKRHRRSSSDTNATGGRSLNCQPTNSSPGSIGKSSMWRINNQFNTGGHSSTLKHHHHNHNGRDSDQDSPTTMHYCMRDPTSGNQMMSTTLNPKNSSSSFSQSVSMKDFNLVSPPGISQAAQAGSSTLNFKNYRSSVRPISDGKSGHSGTLGGRLQLSSGETAAYDASRNVPATVHPNYNTLNHNQLCSIYAAACKQQQQKQNSLDQADTYISGNQPIPVLSNGITGQQPNIGLGATGSSQYDTHQCNYSAADGQQQQETSWTTNYGGQQQQQQQHCGSKHTATTYAIPSAAYADQAVNLYGVGDTNHQLDYRQQDNYGQTSIDACIQQLMNQQYQQQHEQQQQQQQQQQYAMIVNQKVESNNRCLYGNENFTIQNSQAAMQSKVANLPANCGQSIIDSSSSSSGIDIGTHLDCGSSATGTSNSNTSNNGYQLTHPPCEPDPLHNNEQFPPAPSVTAQQQAMNEIDLKQI